MGKIITKQNILIVLVFIPIAITTELITRLIIIVPLFSDPVIPFSIPKVVFYTILFSIVFIKRKGNRDISNDNSRSLDLIKTFQHYPLLIISLCTSLSVTVGLLFILLFNYSIGNEIIIIVFGISGLLIGLTVLLIYKK